MKKLLKDKKNKSDIVIKKIKKSFIKHHMRSTCEYTKGEYYYLIYEFVVIAYSEKTNTVDVSFNISTRPDVSAFFSLLLNEIYNFDDINITEIYLPENDGKILIGEECIIKHQKKLKEKIINEFLEEQIQTHYLRNNYFGEVC